MALTQQERVVVTALAEAWNLYLDLPTEHPDDTDEFRRAIHAATAKVLMREGRRQFKTGKS